jgi:DNA-binding transcriptional LysR family regulator
LRIGAGPGFAVHLLPRACERLLQEAPNVTLKVSIISRDETCTALHKGELDLVLTNLFVSPDNDVAQEYLCDDEFVVYCSVNHPLARRKQVRLPDLVHEEWAIAANNIAAAATLPRAFQENGLPSPRIKLETTSIQLRHYVIATSNLLGFSSRPVVQQAAPRYRFAELPVKELAYSRHSGLVFRKGGYLSPAAKRFIEILKATVKEIAKEA